MLRHGDDPVGLDVDVLLMARAIRALDHERRSGERALDVSLRDLDPLEDAIGLLRIELRRLLVVLDGDLDGVQPRPILVREQQDRLRHVADLALDEKGLILLDQVADVAPRNGAVVHDREAGRVALDAHGPHASAGDRRADGAAEEHAGNDEIIGVACLAGGLADAVLARNADAYGCHGRQTWWARLTRASAPRDRVRTPPRVVASRHPSRRRAA